MMVIDVVVHFTKNLIDLFWDIELEWLIFKENGILQKIFVKFNFDLSQILDGNWSFNGIHFLLLVLRILQGAKHLEVEFPPDFAVLAVLLKGHKFGQYLGFLFLCFERDFLHCVDVETKEEAFEGECQDVDQNHWWGWCWYVSIGSSGGSPKCPI